MTEINVQGRYVNLQNKIALSEEIDIPTKKIASAHIATKKLKTPQIKCMRFRANKNVNIDNNTHRTATLKLTKANKLKLTPLC